MLHEVTGDAGLGLYHAAVPELSPAGYHGPLVVAFDSNVLIDLQEQGAELLDDEDLHVDDGYEESCWRTAPSWTSGCSGTSDSS